jgi:hypothetical protein
MNLPDKIDFAPLMQPVALHLLGEPNMARSKYPTDMRWGTNGSTSVNYETGQFYDHEAEIGGGAIDLVKHKVGCDRAGAISWLRREGLLNGKQSSSPTRPKLATIGATIAATYDYNDESGNLLFQVVRFEPKDFRQRRPDGKGGWIWDLKDVRRVLYRIPELIEAIKKGIPVFLVEGEKDVESLSRIGFTATTNAGGANKWRDDYAEVLRAASINHHSG